MQYDSPAPFLAARAALWLLCLDPILSAEVRIDTAAPGDRGEVWVAPSGGLSVKDFAVEGVGDVNGDGFDDVAIALLETNTGRTLYVIYGRPREPGGERQLPGVERFWQLTPHLGGRDGIPHVTDLARAGDLDGDGYGDFLLGFGQHTYHAPGDGIVLLVRGGRDLVARTRFDALLGSDRVTLFHASEPGYAGVGERARFAGDFDGDGAGDLVLSAPASALDGAAAQAAPPGAVFVVLAGADLPREIDLAGVGSTVRGIRIEGSERAALYGELAAVGDVDGDGLADLALPARDPFGLATLYLVLGRSDPPPVIRLAEAGADPDIIAIEGPDLREPVVAPGDINGDGRADFLLQPFGTQSALIVSGAADLPRRIDLAGLAGLGPRFEFGRPLPHVAPAGDFDGDGQQDIAVAAWRSDPLGRERAGEAVVLTDAGAVGARASFAQGSPGARILGAVWGDSLGEELGPAGDFDGDGFDDLLLVARFGGDLALPADARRSPRIHLIYGGAPEDGPLSLYSCEPDRGPARGGTTVTLRGAGFVETPEVRFGNRPAASVAVVSEFELRVVSPFSASTGVVDLTLRAGGRTTTLPGGFTYTQHDLPEINLFHLEAHGFTLLNADLDAEMMPAAAFGDFTGDGIDELFVSGSRAERLFVSVVTGGNDLPPTLDAFETSPYLSAITSTDVFLPAARDVVVPGDVNGDGRDDLVLLLGHGDAVLLLGRASPGEEIRIEDELFALRASRLTSAAACVSHLSVAGVGDVTADGIDDFAVALVRSVPATTCEDIEGTRPTFLGEGELLIVAGRSAWPEEFALDAPGLIHARLHTSAGDPQQNYGWRVTHLRDANGDGRRDLLVTNRVPRVSPAYVVFGSPALPGEADLDAFVLAGGGARIELEGATAGTLFADHAGDLNGDGLSDILLSNAWGAEPNLDGSIVLPGRRDLPASLRLSRDDAAANGGALRLLSETWTVSGAYARKARSAGDFDADGFDDLILVRRPVGGEAGLRERGNAFLLFGGAELLEGSPTIDPAELGDRGIRIVGRSEGRFNLPAPASGDLNGDGLRDFALFENRDTAHWEGRGREQRLYVVYGIPGPAAPGHFIRGDANDDGRVDLADAAFTLAHLGRGDARPACEDAADIDDDGVINLTDAVYLFVYLFGGGAEPPPPFATAGLDPTEDALGCSQP